jgi:hypothetical protein
MANAEHLAILKQGGAQLTKYGMPGHGHERSLFGTSARATPGGQDHGDILALSMEAAKRPASRPTVLRCSAREGRLGNANPKPCLGVRLRRPSRGALRLSRRSRPHTRCTVEAGKPTPVAR